MNVTLIANVLFLNFCVNIIIVCALDVALSSSYRSDNTKNIPVILIKFYF